MATPRRSQLALTQGLFLLIAGIWPLLSMQSFLWISGQKTDQWLVVTVGLLLAVIGAVLSISGIRNNDQAEFALLGIGTAASLAAIDIYFSIKGTISAVYLLDAVIESGFVFLWVSASIRQSKNERPLSSV